jgi:hypothetical protein
MMILINPFTLAVLNANPEGHNQHWNPDGPARNPDGTPLIRKMSDRIFKGSYDQASKDAGLKPVGGFDNPLNPKARLAFKVYPNGHILEARRDKDTVQLDFTMEGLRDDETRGRLGPGTLSVLRDIAKAAKKYHKAGFKIRVVPSEHRRAAAYRKRLTALGLAPIESHGMNSVWNVNDEQEQE